jgi:hypothetical protein
MRWAGPIALATALASQLGCGVAQRTARSAAEGAISGVAEKIPGREGLKQLSEGVTRRTAGGLVDELSRPEHLDAIHRIAAATATGTVSGASKAASSVPEQMTESMLRGARGELAPLFPECRGADAPVCLERTVERMSRASSAGVAAGIRESLGVWPLAFAFGAGALFALVIAGAWRFYRARRSLPAS